MFSTTIHTTAIRFIAPPVLTWTVLASGSAYALQMPPDAAPVPDLVVTQLISQTHAANVQAALADLHGFG